MRASFEQTPAEQSMLRRISGQMERSRLGRAGVFTLAELREKLTPRRMKQVQTVELRCEAVDFSKSRLRPGGLRERDGSVKPHHRRRGKMEQQIIENEDLRPIRCVERLRLRVNCGNRGFDLVRTGASVPRGFLDETHALRDGDGI